MIERTIKGQVFRVCRPCLDPYREKDDACCYHPGCSKKLFDDYAALFTGSLDLDEGGNAALVIYTCQEHKTFAFENIKSLILEDNNRRFKIPFAILCTRDELHRQGRGIIGDRAASMSQGIDTAF